MISPEKWHQHMEFMGDSHGGYERLDAKHSALFLEDNQTLLVTFEDAQSVRAHPDHVPMGWTIAEEAGWSQLSVMAEGDTWFRSEEIYRFFDELVDDGYFDEFDRIVFYGTGDCGYAAAAFSVAAPGSTVIVVNPQATLDPRVTEWDPRFASHRRMNFTGRYGYAPDMLDAAERAFVLYDPENPFDAMHTALFTKPNVTKLRCRHLGPKLDDELAQMGILTEVIDAACEGHLNEQVFHRLYRTRRNNTRYLRRLLDKVEAKNHPYLAAMLCKSVADRAKAPKFQKRLAELEEQLTRAGTALPWRLSDGSPA